MMHPQSPMILSTCQPCIPGALRGGLTRTRFYDGMFLTQADLENEQLYWRMKRRLTNRALGHGVVWGLRLEIDQTGRLRLSPGYALDCCGNDLVVECPVETTIKELWDRADPEVKKGSDAARVIHACIMLEYVECPEQIRPVHRDACNPGGGGCEPSRIRETTRLVLVRPCERRERPTSTDGQLYNNGLATVPGALDFCTNPYPGPRCEGRHHGVYLGCVWLSPTGTFEKLEPCECRKYVILWPLLEYWFLQLGITPPFPMMASAMHGERVAMEPGNVLTNVVGVMTRDRSRRFARNAASTLADPVLASEASVAPLSRAPLRDVVAEVAARLPLTSLFETGGLRMMGSSERAAAPVVEPKALEGVSIGALLDLGPEATFERLAAGKPTPALAEAVNKLFVAAENVVRELAKKAAKHGSLARSNLTDPKLKESLLEIRGVTREIVDAATEAATQRE